MAVNVRSYIQTMQALVPGMKAAGFGRVVNIASRAALGHVNQTVYSATKAALIGLTKTWASEFASHGITCNAIGPGPVDTDMFRSVYPEGSAKRAAYLARIPVGTAGRAGRHRPRDELFPRREGPPSSPVRSCSSAGG